MSKKWTVSSTFQVIIDLFVFVAPTSGGLQGMNYWYRLASHRLMQPIKVCGMDPQHRHELQENDLEEFLKRLGELWTRYGTRTLIIIAVVVVAFVAVRWVRQKAVTQHENAWAELAGSTSPASFREVAITYDDKTVRTLALLRGADLLLKEQFRAAVDQAQAEQGTPLNEARQMYQRVIDEAPQVLYRLNARIGLARVAETNGKWEEAVMQYRLIIKEAGEGYEAISSLAERSLTLLDELPTQVYFAPEPVAEASSTQPSGQSSEASEAESTKEPRATTVTEPADITSAP